MSDTLSKNTQRFFIVLLICITYCANAALPQYSVKAYTCADKNLLVNEIVNKKYASKFCNSQQCRFVLENTRCTHWIYMEINNSELEPYIINSAIFFHDITAYFYDGDMKFLDSVSTGYDIDTEFKHIKTASNAISVPISKKIKCYIKFKTYMSTGIDFSVLKNRDFINQKATEHTFNGIVNGIFFLAIIYSALFSLLLWKRIYVFYMIYVLSFWVFMLSINFETPLYFSWLHLPFGLGFYVVPHKIITISLLLYTRELLQLRTSLSVFSKISLFTVFCLSILLAVYLTTGWSWQDSAVNKMALIPSYIASILLICRKYKPAWFVFVGISLMYIAFLSIHFELDIPVFFTFSFYGICEIIVFGISITYWWKSLVIEKEKALHSALASAEEITKIKQNQNTVLEREVAFKTQELKLANQQLSVYIKQVEKQKQSLETDNDQLKVKVIDQIKARSDDKVMNFEDFKINFPDDESCYTYLEDIKWASGFQCYKCRNDKYGSRKLANTIPARRCTKCGFVNTVSSYTLYHNIKFPLQKAFYITYMIGTDKSKTLEELSKELDLRMATIHSFLKKVKEARDAYKSKKKHKNGWTHLMLYHVKDNTTSKNLVQDEE